MISGIRKAKADAKVTMRTGVERVTVRGPLDLLDSLRPALDDVRAAGCVTNLELEASEAPNLLAEVVL